MTQAALVTDSPSDSAARSIFAVSVYLCSSLFAFLAGNMFNYALIIYCRHISSSEGFTGMVNLAAYVVPLCLTLNVAPLIDRLPRKRLLLLFQGVWMSTALALALAIGRDPGERASHALVIALSLINGVAFTFLMPARFTFIADIAPERLLGRFTILLNVLLIVGFGLAPVLVGQAREHFSWAELFGIVVALFAVSQALLSFTPAVRTRRERGDARASAASGLRQLIEQPLLLELLASTLITFFALGPIQILVPEFARVALGMTEGQRGGLMAMLGVGLLLGGICALFAARTRRGALLLSTQAATGIAILCLAQATGFAGAGSALLVAGLCGGLGGSVIPACIQIQVQGQFRGRVMSYYSLVSLMTPALSGALFGALADYWGMAWALKAAALTLVLMAGLATLVLKGVRSYV